MRIAINCRPMMGLRPTGIGRYTQQLIHHLGVEDQDNTYWLYARKGLFDRKRRFPEVNYDNFIIKADYFNLGPARIVPRCDIYHSPSPEDVTRAPGKVIVTIHDLIYKTFPQSHTAETIRLTEKYMQTIVKRARKLICISQSTRADLHKLYDVPKAKTCVIYNGVNHQVFYALTAQQTQDAVPWLKSKGIDGVFVLFVGTIEPRKNLVGILHAVAQIKSQGRLNFKVVIAGMQGWMSEGNVDVVKELGLMHDVVFLGFITDGQLARLYNLASVFVFPSFYEGFGFPILEAMACGCPVVTSNNSSCAELAADAAITIDPQNPSLIADAIERLLNDRILRRKYIDAGFARAAEFTFERCAREVIQVYKEAGQ